MPKEIKKEEKKTDEKPIADKQATNQKPAKPPVAEEKIEVPAKFKDILEQIEKMTVLDLAELVKILEKKFNVQSAMPMAMAPSAGAAAEGEAPAVQEKSAFNVEITAMGDKKIDVIKAVRAVTEIGLKDAKDLVEAAPKMVKEGVPKEEAEKIKKQLEEAGATVTLK